MPCGFDGFNAGDSCGSFTKTTGILMKKRRSIFAITLFGYAFLYIPLVSLIIFSFNASKNVSTWTGFSLQWYATLFQNDQIISAFWNSLTVALFASTLSVVLGLLASLVIVKTSQFFGRNIFKGLVSAPLVMPEVLLGLSFLLLFVSMEDMIGWPKTGSLATITLAHTTIALAYVTAILTAQLANVDEALTEAAMDLGASPFKAFFVITIPIIFPALMGGWLLAFVLSFDDVVIASFVAGPESTTLPMMIFSSIRFGVTPEINALATLLIFVIAGLIFVVGFLNQRQKNFLKTPTSQEEDLAEDL
jgi:putrescine transport system permease protein